MGPLGAALGSLKAVYLGFAATLRVQKKTGIDFEAQKALQKIQNGAPNGQQSDANNNIKQECFEDLRGSVLGLSWVVLGSILGSTLNIFWSDVVDLREHVCF